MKNVPVIKKDSLPRKIFYQRFVQIFFGAMVLAASCGNPARTQKQTNPEDSSNYSKESTGILFLTYSISRNKETDEYMVALTGKTLVGGKIKPVTQPELVQKGDLEYKILDHNSRVIERNFIENPLRRSLEFVGNDGKLGKMNIQEDSATFFLRIQYDKAGRFIVLEKYISPDSSNTHLLTHEIP